MGRHYIRFSPGLESCHRREVGPEYLFRPLRPGYKLWPSTPFVRKQPMIRISALVLAAAILTLPMFAGRAVGAGDEGKCTIATKGDSPTARACAKGGRAEAKKMMKEMVKQAKTAGQKFTCDGCHKDLDNYELTKNATEDFKKLEAVAKVK